MSYKVTKVPDEVGSMWRLIVFTASTQSELTDLKNRALLKGWWPYFDGVDPVTGQQSSWMRKPCDALPADRLDT